MLGDGPPASALRASRLLLVVRLSSERVRQVVRQDCSVAKKQEPLPAPCVSRALSGTRLPPLELEVPEIHRVVRFKRRRQRLTDSRL